MFQYTNLARPWIILILACCMGLSSLCIQLFKANLEMKEQLQHHVVNISMEEPVMRGNTEKIKSGIE